MPRNKDGFLKPEALRSGIPDQWAAMVNGVRHEVSLTHDTRQGGYVTVHVLLWLSDEQELVREVHAWQSGHDLGFARRKFREIVRAQGGSA